MPRKFWELFDNEKNEFPAKSSSYLACPSGSEIWEKPTNSSEDSSESDDYGLMSSYVEVMDKIENSAEIFECKAKDYGHILEMKAVLEMKAALWVYKEVIENELIGFADSLNLLDTNFDNLVENELDKMTTNDGQNDSDIHYSRLCFFHKIALALVKDEALGRNKQWDKHLKRLLTDTAVLQMNEPKLILLLNDEDGINWASANCADPKLAAKFMESIRKMPNWADRVHFDALSQLIPKFAYFQSVFCYGTPTADFFHIKAKLSVIVQTNVLHAIERTFPEILHFEKQLDCSYLELLLKKLEHKSGTLLAQCYEARLSLPYLMESVKHFKNYLSGILSMDDQLKLIIEEKIEEIEESVYGAISEEKPTEWRQNLCKLVKLKELLSEIYANPKGCTFQQMFLWEPGCQTEKELTDAFYYQRNFIKECNYTAINKLMQYQSDQILAKPAAKMKLWKMLSELGPEQIINYNGTWESEVMRKRRKEVFSDNKVLLSHYDRILFGANLKRDEDDPFVHLLLADVIIFVRWVEEKLGLTRRRSIATKRIEKSWETRKEIFEGFYDKIWEEDERTVRQLGEVVTGLLIKLKQCLEKDMTKVLEDELWAQIMEEGNAKSMDMEKRRAYEKWKRSLHWDIIEALIREESTLADRMKNAVLLNKNSFQPKLEFVVGEENAKEILAKLNENSKKEKAVASPPSTPVAENKMKNLNIISPKASKNLHLKDIHQQIELDQIEMEWNMLKSVELSKVKNAKKLIGQLFVLLKQIVAKMDNLQVQNEQNFVASEEQIVGNGLKLRKFAKFMAENYKLVNAINAINEHIITLLSTLLELQRTDNAQMEKRIIDNFKMLFYQFKNLEAQRKLDQNLLFMRTMNEEKSQIGEGKLGNTKMPEEMPMIYQISDGWQEIEFSERKSRNIAKNNLIQQKVGINEQTENGRIAQRNKIKAIRNIFKEWSGDVQFQLPPMFYLKPDNKSLSTICFVPHGFDIHAKILGQFQCDLTKAKLCSDNSIYCVFCKNPLVNFLKKIHLTVPKFEIKFMGTLFDVNFIAIPQVGQVPPKLNFNGKLIQIILTKFGKEIGTLLKESFVDVYTNEKDEKIGREKHEKFRMELEDELFAIGDDDDKAARIMEKLEKMGSYEERTTAQNDSMKEALKKAEMKRKTIGQLKENLNVLWDHSLPLALLEHLLSSNELYILHQTEDESVLNGSTLRRFRTFYAFVELWAKEKKLFNETAGHFNSQVILTMVTKVFLLFPGETSVAFLLEKFFLIYSFWVWPMPLQLKEINYAKEGAFLNWSPEREWFERKQSKIGNAQIGTEMPIISPIFPHKNMANKIQPSVAKNILNEFLNETKQFMATKDEDLSKNS
ncbi:hypothetical protein niasHT_018946 [Heterodera trifolii]|uniref:polynucleotide adenylyltransferase n=1 Tax=Heterodera trifolii TaxID=157864 RepID=A0ABD2LDN4_9BILA